MSNFTCVKCLCSLRTIWIWYFVQNLWLLVTFNFPALQSCYFAGFPFLWHWGFFSVYVLQTCSITLWNMIQTTGFMWYTSFLQFSSLTGSVRIAFLSHKALSVAFDSNQFGNIGEIILSVVLHAFVDRERELINQILVFFKIYQEKKSLHGIKTVKCFWFLFKLCWFFL